MSITDTAARRLVRRVMRAFLGELRAILKRDAPAYYAAHPDAPRPCHSCAFSPSTDRWTGMETTANHVREALANGSDFSCHQGLPWRKPLQDWTPAEIRKQIFNPTPCAAYTICRRAADAPDAFTRAAGKTMRKEDARG
jgi:hypothetical protein